MCNITTKRFCKQLAREMMSEGLGWFGTVTVSPIPGLLLLTIAACDIITIVLVMNA